MRSLLAVGLVWLSGVAHAAQSDAACLVVHDGYWQVATLDVRSGRTRVVTRSAVDKTRLSWFPDGQLLVSRSDGVLTVVDPETRKESAIELEQQPLLDAAVSPDGARIAFSFSTAIDGNDIWIVEWPTRKVENIVRMPSLQHEPAWSADGASLYFLSGNGGQAHDIWRYAQKTHATEQLTAGELYHFDVATGPGGELAFSSNRDGNYEIYVRHADGTTQRLTDDPALDARPSFSPDGKTLLFESSRSGTTQIYRLDVKTAQASAVTKVASGARQPVWRPKS